MKNKGLFTAQEKPEDSRSQDDIEKQHKLLEEYHSSEKVSVLFWNAFFLEFTSSIAADTVRLLSSFEAAVSENKIHLFSVSQSVWDHQILTTCFKRM